MPNRVTSETVFSVRVRSLGGPVFAVESLPDKRAWLPQRVLMWVVIKSFQAKILIFDGMRASNRLPVDAEDPTPRWQATGRQVCQTLVQAA